MTVVVALRQNNSLYVAADRLISGDNIKTTMSRPKIWSRPGYLFGFCGTLEGEHVQSKFKPSKPTGDIDTFMQGQFLEELKDFYDEWNIFRDQRNDDGLGLIVCTGEYIYEHSPAYLTMTRYEIPYMSIGSGSQYAMGSLYSTQDLTDPRERLRRSVKAACEFSTSCGLPMDILSMRIKHAGGNA